MIAGPSTRPEVRGFAWTRADLCRWLEERFAKTYHPSSMTRATGGMGFSRQDDRARATIRKGSAEAVLGSASKKGASRHPEGDRHGRGASRQAPTAVVSG